MNPVEQEIHDWLLANFELDELFPPDESDDSIEEQEARIDAGDGDD